MSEEAFREKLRIRKEREEPIKQVHVYYHIACMHHWEAVVIEQLRAMAFAGISSVRACVLGTSTQAWTVANYARQLGILMEVFMQSTYLEYYETPTLSELWRHSRYCEDAFMYIHTKGVSVTVDPVKEKWRRMMMKYIVFSINDNARLLGEYDIVGANWQHNPTFPHYQGNFWLARADWIRNLQEPESYKHSRDINWFLCGWPWARMHAEMWLGSKNYHHMFSHACENVQWYLGEGFVDHNVPGFNYEDTNLRQQPELANDYQGSGGLLPADIGSGDSCR